MKSFTEYQWHGHSIKIEATSSPRFLWMNHTFEVTVDNQKTRHNNERFLTHTKTRFTVNHGKQKLKGQIVSYGFPGSPVVSQSTIIDDTIVGHNQLLVKKRYLTYAFLSAVAYSIL